MTGRRRQISRTVRGTKRDAEKKLNALVAEAEQGTHVGSEATFRDVAERWLALSASDLSPTTLRRYRGLLAKHIYPALGDRPAHVIRTSELDDLYLGLVEGGGLSPASVRQVHAVIRRALRQAVRWGWVGANAAANTTPPRVRRPEITPPEVEDVVNLLQVAKEVCPDFGRFLHVAVTTGARRGELCALRWERIEWDAATVTISCSIAEVEGGIVEKATKTHAIRRIALDEHTLAVLQQHRAETLCRAKATEGDIRPSAYVFTHDPGGAVPWTPDYVTKSFQRLRTAAGLERVRLHDLRHFAATRLLAAGVPVRTVAGRLGHANASTTLGVYAHFVEASDRSAASILGGLTRRTNWQEQ